MTQLSINLNKIALIRNARDTKHPDPCEFAASVIRAGAHGITVHPRPDQRHIRAFLALIEQIRPEQVTLVPDGDDQLTSDHGFDITRDGDRLRPIVEQLKGWGCRVSLFMDPDPAQISLVRALGADRVELYTETYARAHECGDYGPSLAQFQEAAAEATLHGLGINAGHDLNLSNLPDFHIDALLEVSIGHAFTIDALRYGVTDAVSRYLQALDAAGRS